jgi:hypothetical protein
LWPVEADHGHSEAIGGFSISEIISEASMTTFDKSERTFEKKFAQDEKIAFKANARRNNLVGPWAAEKLGLVGADAEPYAQSVVKAELEKPGT